LLIRANPVLLNKILPKQISGLTAFCYMSKVISPVDLPHLPAG